MTYSDGLPIGVSFIVKNITALPGRAIKVFNTSIAPGKSLDVMKVPGIGEGDVRDALLKGDLGLKLKNKQLAIVSSSIVLPESDAVYISFLNTYGLKNNILNNKTSPLGDPNLSYLSQPLWFIDPANLTGLASDQNDGYTSTTPLLTFKEYSNRVCKAAIISNNHYVPLLQNTTIKYLSSPPDPLTDPISLNIERLGSFNLSFIYDPVVIRTNTISSISTVRGGTDWWRLTATDNFSLQDLVSNGKMIINTTNNTCAFLTNINGVIADSSEWLANQINPVKEIITPAYFPPQINNNYEIVSLNRVKLGSLNIRQRGDASDTTFFKSSISFLNFVFAQSLAGNGYPDAIQISAQMSGIGLNSSGVCFTQCIFEGNVNHLSAYNIMLNCYVSGNQCTNNSRHLTLGGYQNGITTSGSIVISDGYSLIAGRVGDQQAAEKSLILVSLVTMYNTTDHFDAFTGESGTQIRIYQSNYGVPPLICGVVGRYLFRLVNGSVLLNMSTTPLWGNIVTASCFKFMANASIPCNMVSYNYNTLALGTTAYEVTIANLDDPAIFNGNAVDPGTGCSVRPFSSH